MYLIFSFVTVIAVVAIAVFIVIGSLSSGLLGSRGNFLSQLGDFRVVTVNALVKHGHQMLRNLENDPALDFKNSLHICSDPNTYGISRPVFQISVELV
jgi:hypothetical protein